MNLNKDKLNAFLPNFLQKNLNSLEEDLFKSLISELNSIEISGKYHLLLRAPFSYDFDELFNTCEVTQEHRIELLSRFYRILLEEKQASSKIQDELISHYIKRATKGKLTDFQLNHKHFEHLIFKNSNGSHENYHLDGVSESAKAKVFITTPEKAKFFTNESIKEVSDEILSNLSPNNLMEFVLRLRYLIKVTKSVPSEFYFELLERVFSMMNFIPEYNFILVDLVIAILKFHQSEQIIENRCQIFSTAIHALTSKYGTEQQNLFTGLKITPMRKIPKLLIRMLVSSSHNNYEES